MKKFYFVQYLLRRVKVKEVPEKWKKKVEDTVFAWESRSKRSARKVEKKGGRQGGINDKKAIL